MPTIEKLTALEILDSRGRPTVGVSCKLKEGPNAWASVPSGASTGKAEAVELRDGDPARYGGLGCRRAVANVHGPIQSALRGREFLHQRELDAELLALDGTPNKSALGANAILAVSIAFARAYALAEGTPLYRHFAHMIGSSSPRLPRLTVNLFSGGKHAGGQVPIQDVSVVPLEAKSIDESLATTSAVYQSAAKLCAKKYNTRTLVADEGGLAPPFPSADAMLEDAVEAIELAGFSPGKDVALAVDVASSHFYEGGKYDLKGSAAGALTGGISSTGSAGEGTGCTAAPLSPTEMIDQLLRWLDRYPILSLEDGLAEDDWMHWPLLRQRATHLSPGSAKVSPTPVLRYSEEPGSFAARPGSSEYLRTGVHTASPGATSCLILGDDLLCTNPTRIQKAIDTKSANALLLKVNQIGTLTEAARALELARSAGWSVTVSARSGETEDDWLADLATGWAGDQIKIGSITRSERLAKYNRLLAIEAEAGLPMAGWPGR